MKGKQFPVHWLKGKELPTHWLINLDDEDKTPTNKTDSPKDNVTNDKVEEGNEGVKFFKNPGNVDDDPASIKKLDLKSLTPFQKTEVLSSNFWEYIAQGAKNIIRLPGTWT